MGPLTPTTSPTSPRKPLGPFARPKTTNVFQVRLAMGLPVLPPDPEKSSLMEAPAPAPRQSPAAPVAQQPAAAKACPGHGSRANGTFYIHPDSVECYG